MHTQATGEVIFIALAVSWIVIALTGKFLPTCYVLQITYKNIPTDKK